MRGKFWEENRESLKDLSFSKFFFRDWRVRAIILASSGMVEEDRSSGFLRAKRARMKASL